MAHQKSFHIDTPDTFSIRKKIADWINSLTNIEKETARKNINVNREIQDVTEKKERVRVK